MPRFVIKIQEKRYLTRISRILNIFYYFTNMNVKISKKGREIINNKELAAKLVMAVVNNKAELEKGQVVRVDNTPIGVRFVTTIPENPPSKCK